MTQKYYLLLLFTCISILSFGQAPSKVDSASNSILDISEQMPSFPGGEQAFFKFLAQNIRYPGIARDQGLQGKLYIEFVVTKQGHITDVKIIKGTIGGGCEEEALRIIKSMPDWIPGKQNGDLVNVRYRMPIIFQLGDNNPKPKKGKKEIRMEKRLQRKEIQHGLD